jgi:antitoxin VapB
MNSTQQIAKVFQTGRSQAVRLPKAFRFDVKEVYIFKVGDQVILSPRPTSWDDFFNSDERPTDDFMQNHTDLPLQERTLFE